MKKSLLTLVLTGVATCIMAAPVSQETTQRLASFFFHEMGGHTELTYVEMPQFPHIHFYSATEGNGFVIMAADDIVTPVLAYSTTTAMNATEVPVNTAYWLSEYENQITWNIENGHSAAAEVTAAWDNLMSMTPAPQTSKMPAAAGLYNTANLLTTTWGQSPYYNSQCPYDSYEGENTLTGCVATAMAQIMKYWRHPLRGVGSYSYTDPNYGTQSANFSDTVFNYAIMPNQLTSNSSQAEKNAVALLMRRCGIGAEVFYGVDGSSASTIGFNYTYKSAESAYGEHFKYLHSLHAVSLEDYTDAAWVATLKDEINHGRPIQYSAGNEETGGGHSFICCGYDNTGKLYFNWGWSSLYDGYYTVGQLNPGSDRYNLRNRAIVGIEPDTTEAATTTVTLTSNVPGGATTTGAGTYHSYTDWVTISALGTPGYLIDGWDDHNVYNPFTFLANGGNVTHTARCSRMTGDTLGYCKDEYSTAYGSKSSSKTYVWGIRFDSVSIGPRRQLETIKTFISETGNYSIYLYGGNDTMPTGSPIKSYNVNITNVDSWGTLNLPNPVPVDRSQSLWIIFEWTGKGYPKSCSEFRGNIDGAWSYSSNEWSNYVRDDETYISWMIRGIFGDNPGPYEITVEPDSANHGTTTGSGKYAAGTTVTLTATPNAGYLFRCWNDGVTAATRSITVTDVARYVACFDADPKTGVTAAEVENIAVYGNGSDIIIENAAGATAAIYDAAGRLVQTLTVGTTRESIALPAGSYFVKVEGKSFKAVVSK